MSFLLPPTAPPNPAQAATRPHPREKRGDEYTSPEAKPIPRARDPPKKGGGPEGVSVGKKENKWGGPTLLHTRTEGQKTRQKEFGKGPDIGAFALGIMRRALDESIAYAKERKTFGVPIAQHQMIQSILANMAIKVEASRLLTYAAAKALDDGAAATIYSSYAKAFSADAAMEVTTDAVQVFGGYGYTKEYPVEKLMRDAKLLQIYEGTSQIQRVVIARHLLGR